MSPDELKALAGKPVAAKRLGWDDPEEGRVTDTDILEPPAWRDEGLDEDVAGELAVTEYPGDETCPAFTSYTVGGAAVDPATVRPADPV